MEDDGHIYDSIHVAMRNNRLESGILLNCMSLLLVPGTSTESTYIHSSKLVPTGRRPGFVGAGQLRLSEKSPAFGVTGLLAPRSAWDG